MTDKKEIANRLREFGELRFGTMIQFANTLKISKSNLNQYLSGVALPGPKLILKLAAMDCDLNWLMTGEHSKDVSIIEKQLNEREEVIRGKEKELAERERRLLTVAENIVNSSKDSTNKKMPRK